MNKQHQTATQKLKAMVFRLVLSPSLGRAYSQKVLFPARCAEQAPANRPQREREGGVGAPAEPGSLIHLSTGLHGEQMEAVSSIKVTRSS